ncbi:MAG: PEP/pyruvate-binding domain-containing protein [Burkholderiales bacterium]
MTSNNRRAFFIDVQTGERPPANASAMGHKAYNLARMAAIGLPVPQAFVLGTGFCPTEDALDAEAQADLAQTLTANLRRLERATGLTYGGSRRPLLLSVRSGASISMPGMLDTILNVGLNETTVRGLLRTTGNPRLTWDSYRRLIQSFAEVVDGCPSEPFEALLAHALEQSHSSRPQELDSRALSQLAREYLALYRKLGGRNFPQDPMEQLKAAVHGVYRSWGSARAREYRRLNKIANDLGTAVTVQRMVFGNAGGTSGSGVAFTRDPVTGENRLYMDFMFNAQGEDVVSGRHRACDGAELATILPEIARELVEAARTVEAEFKDMQELEFTVQDETLYLLQARSGKRTALAELRIASDQVREGLIEPAEALARVGRVEVAVMQNAKAVENGACPVLCEATSASSGVASGAIVLDSEAARSRSGEAPVILVRRDAETCDIAALAVAEGLLTARGGRTSHAAVVARKMNKVALVGCDSLTIDLAARTCTINGVTLTEGETICLDGTTGRVLLGTPDIVRNPLDAELAEVDHWRKLAARTPKVRVRAG